ncbi:hypothetical protein MBM_03214 [Drepanopeziza brunnea f. sp. 'multigermtubi' MB_m1]|uniref:Uncharacterized protein n=1 Tax=Marssonina brunnea f. sp. multigermtubi (strain MB_m1) TaxID=1072389 RepID=K1X1T0_MARBU|nr:uncharacterized protein MBM_03214 [Drepanopeziza brunnea f. sp. 'multigermtubi' MB_m1]EKD18972.1 hypothetical protein MBM_03214 [Drepanopeziza brunnea f. sp. 'multigermtubi' MB_m1]
MFEDNTLGCDVQLVQIHFTMIKGLDTLSEDPIINHQNRRAFALPTPAAATRGSREYLLNNLPCLQDFQASLGVDSKSLPLSKGQKINKLHTLAMTVTRNLECDRGGLERVLIDSALPGLGSMRATFLPGCSAYTLELLLDWLSNVEQPTGQPTPAHPTQALEAEALTMPALTPPIRLILFEVRIAGSCRGGETSSMFHVGLIPVFAPSFQIPACLIENCLSCLIFGYPRLADVSQSCSVMAVTSFIIYLINCFKHSGTCLLSFVDRFNLWHIPIFGKRRPTRPITHRDILSFWSGYSGPYLLAYTLFAYTLEIGTNEVQENGCLL